MQNSQIEQVNGGSFNLRKTAYAANQHSVSIIGSDVGRAHLPQNFANLSAQEQFDKQNIEPRQQPAPPGSDLIPRSPQLNAAPPKAPMQYPPQEESLAGLLAIGKQNSQPAPDFDDGLNDRSSPIRDKAPP